MNDSGQLALPSKPMSLRDPVQDYLRQAIVSGQYQPGARLVKREIRELLNVSRPPVPEAFCKLEAEKLITTVLHRGPMVASVSRTESREIYELRGVLEAHATTQFTKIASDKEIEQLRAIIKKLHAEAHLNDKIILLENVKSVYDIILTGCSNALIRETLLSLLSRISVLRSTSLSQPYRLPQSLAEIDCIYELIRLRQADAAGQAALGHILEAQEIELAVLPQEGVIP